MFYFLPFSNSFHAFAVLDDALHIAASAIHGLDFIVSLNFEHIVKNKAKQITTRINKIVGYKEVGIFEPKEVIDYEY
jgi:hypothetical protein